MSETPSEARTNEPVEPADGATPPRTPRWVKISALVVLIIAVLVVILMVVGGGEHGPGRHTGGNDSVQSPASGAPQQRTAPPESGHMPPAGGHSP